MKTLVASLAVVVLCGCGPQSAVLEGDDPTSTSQSDLAAQATLQFNADWSVRQSAALVKGGELRIEYSAQRIQDCLGMQNGQPAWVATAHYVLGDAPERTVQVGGYSTTGVPSVLTLDREGPLTLWFEVTNVWGCQWFDSAWGQNFHFNVSTATPVKFNADWSTQVLGDLSSAKVLSIEYAIERLPNCRSWYRGMAAWEILAYVRFDGGPVKSAVATRQIGQQRLSSPANFDIPDGAQQAEVWFYASDIGGCTQWDSNYGANYQLSLQ
ncbi:MAG: DUF6209 family protein [Archangium sp.]